MAQAPAYQMYAADFAMTTTGWPSDPVAAHIRFMNSQWINGGLPEDTGELAAIAGLTKKKFAEAWKWLEKRYPVCADGMRRNPRLEIERLKQQQYREKQANAAAMRWHKQAPSQSDALQSSSSSTTTPTKSKTKPTTAREPFDGEMWMRAIFNAHPRPEWGYKAQTAWLGALHAEMSENGWNEIQAAEFLLARSQLYAECVKAWPRAEISKCNGTYSFFESRIYKQDEALWRRTNGERKAQTQQDQQRDELRELVVGDVDGKSHLEATIPQHRLLTDAGGKARSTGGLVSISSADREGEIH